MRILICGDCVINSSTIHVSKPLKEYIALHDYRICNFEGPVIDDTFSFTPSHKIGSHVSNSVSAANTLAEMGFNIAALANNHIMDFGWGGVKNSFQFLSEAGFQWVGVGETFEEAYAPLILKKGTEELALINVCQAEFGVMKTRCDAKPGYAWINNSELYNIVQTQRQCGRAIIIFAHCGLEKSAYPLPEWMDTYRKLVEITNGPVIATHPHIIQGTEIWSGKPIVYSLGNYIFEHKPPVLDLNWNNGMIISYDTITGEFECRITRFENNNIRFEEEDLSKQIMAERNSLIDREKLEEVANYMVEKYWKQMYDGYYSNLIQGERFSVILKCVIKSVAKKLLGRNISREDMLLHNIQIETHRWVVERYLYNLNRDKNSF